MKYPTKQQILEINQTYPPKVLKFMKKDFKRLWKKYPTHHKELLIMMTSILSTLYNLEPPYHKNGISYSYIPKTKTITIPQKLSIISTLHELGHHLYGPSELEACRFSVHLFKQTFPISYKKCKWNGHMLILNN